MTRKQIKSDILSILDGFGGSTQPYVYNCTNKSAFQEGDSMKFEDIFLKNVINFINDREFLYAQCDNIKKWKFANSLFEIIVMYFHALGEFPSKENLEIRETQKAKFIKLFNDGKLSEENLRKLIP